MSWSSPPLCFSQSHSRPAQTPLLVHFVIFSNQHPPFFQLSQLYISTISVQQRHGDFESLKSTCFWFYFFSFFILAIVVDHFKHSLANTHCSPESLPSLHIFLQNFNPRTMQSFYFCSAMARLLSSGKIHGTLQNGAGIKSWSPTSLEPPQFNYSSTSSPSNFVPSKPVLSTNHLFLILRRVPIS